MTTADHLVRAKIPAAHAKAIVGDMDSAVTATGTTAADAYTVRAAVTVVTGGAATTGVVLRVANKGDTYEVINNSTTDKNLYPPSGGKLNNGTADIGAVLLPGATAVCRCTGTVDYSVLSNGLGA